MMIQGTAVISAYRSKIKSKYLFPPEILRLWGIFLPKPEDPVTKEPQTDAIYSIPCNDCAHRTDQKSVWYTFERASKCGLLLKKRKIQVFLEHTCLTNHTTGWDKSKIITSNRRYHQCLCLEAWQINSVHAPLNRDDDGLLSFLKPIYTSLGKKGQPISECIKNLLLQRLDHP